MIVQPVENRIVDQDGKPYPYPSKGTNFPFKWTQAEWLAVLRARGYEDDVRRMERAQSKRERKAAKRRNDVAASTPTGRYLRRAFTEHRSFAPLFINRNGELV